MNVFDEGSEGRGADVEVLKITDEGNPERLTATVVVDVPHPIAQTMADNAKPVHLKGRELAFYVPRKFD